MPKPARRLEQYGPNLLTPANRRGPLLRFLLQFHNVLIYVLLASACVTALLAHWVDTGVIVGVVFINAVIGFIQEGKAEKAMDAIRRMLSPEATVMRDGKREVIAAEALVPGDIVLLQSGDKVPADLRLLSVKNLRIEEAALTGESTAVEKNIDAVDEKAVLGDRYCMAYSSTLVVYGQGTGVVIATADNTEIGRISAMLDEVQAMTTPLLRQMDVFGRWLTIAIMALTVVAFLDRLAGAPVRHRRHVHRRSQHRRGGDPGRTAGRVDHHAGAGRAAHGQTQRHHPPPAGRRSAGIGDGDLHRQDRHAHAQRNDGATRDHRRPGVRGERRRLCTARRLFYRRQGNRHHRRRRNAGSGARRVAVQRCRTAMRSGGTWQIAGDPTEAALITLAMKAGSGSRART